MNASHGEVDIRSREYWFKVVDFLQQEWALIDGAEHAKAREIIAAPQPPFLERPHPNGRICSSGRFWK